MNVKYNIEIFVLLNICLIKIKLIKQQIIVKHIWKYIKYKIYQWHRMFKEKLKLDFQNFWYLDSYCYIYFGNLFCVAVRKY
jgi:hypothetical protein